MRLCEVVRRPAKPMKDHGCRFALHSKALENKLISHAFTISKTLPHLCVLGIEVAACAYERLHVS